MFRRHFKTTVKCAYLNLWLSCRLGRLSISRELCALEVTNKIPISMFLPSDSGHGRCALGLTSFLVTLHNEFIGRCKSLLEDESR